MGYLGLNIRKIRERWDLSQEEFGLLVHATRGMIMQYENRGTKPKNETLSQLVKVTGLPLEMLSASPLEDAEIPEIDQLSWMTIQNFRNDPDLIDAGPNEEEMRELMKTKKPRNPSQSTEFVELLKSNDEFFKNQYTSFNRQVLANLDLVLATLRTVASRQEADEEVILRSLARIEERQENELFEDAGRRRNQIEKDADTYGKPGV